MDFTIPTLTLQPLVENAIRYGVRRSEDGIGTVTIRTMESPDNYKIHVIDDGPGFMVDQIPDDGMSHMGINNVNDRLKRVCGGELVIDSVLGRGTDAVITIPKKLSH
jgi:sensor histidine kinase YesM